MIDRILLKEPGKIIKKDQGWIDRKVDEEILRRTAASYHQLAFQAKY